MQLYGTIYAAKTKREGAAQKHFALPLGISFSVGFPAAFDLCLGGLGLEAGALDLALHRGLFADGCGLLGGRDYTFRRLIFCFD